MLEHGFSMRMNIVIKTTMDPLNKANRYRIRTNVGFISGDTSNIPGLLLYGKTIKKTNIDTRLKPHLRGTNKLGHKK